MILSLSSSIIKNKSYLRFFSSFLNKPSWSINEEYKINHKFNKKSRY